MNDDLTSFDVESSYPRTWYVFSLVKSTFSLVFQGCFKFFSHVSFTQFFSVLH